MDVCPFVGRMPVFRHQVSSLQNAESSSPGEFHPQALREPDVTASRHPALIIPSQLCETCLTVWLPPLRLLKSPKIPKIPLTHNIFFWYFSTFKNESLSIFCVNFGKPKATGVLFLTVNFWKGGWRHEIDKGFGGGIDGGGFA